MALLEHKMYVDFQPILLHSYHSGVSRVATHVLYLGTCPAFPLSKKYQPAVRHRIAATGMPTPGPMVVALLWSALEVGLSDCGSLRVELLTVLLGVMLVMPVRLLLGVSAAASVR